jgi:hypothetical protein
LVLDPQGRICRIGSVMALGTDVVGTLILDRPHYGEDGFGAEFLVEGGMTTRTGNRALLRGVLVE